MIFSSGLQLPEGPVALHDGSWLIVEGGQRGCVTHISADGRAKRVVAATGGPNGLAIDRAGTIWVADTRPPALIRLTLDGRFERVLTACNDEPFVYPNDLCFGPDGHLYLTDSGISDADFAPDGATVRSDYLDLKIDGRVYRIDPRTFEAAKIDTGLRYPNGIAFGPDGELYVNETISGMVYRYRLQDGRQAGQRHEFGNVIRPDAPRGFKGPDGMAFGSNGKLYVTVYGVGEVVVLERDGSVGETIVTEGLQPTNVAFPADDGMKIFVTEFQRGRMEVFEVETNGLPLWT